MLAVYGQPVQTGELVEIVGRPPRGVRDTLRGLWRRGLATSPQHGYWTLASRAVAIALGGGASTSTASDHDPPIAVVAIGEAEASGGDADGHGRALGPVQRAVLPVLAASGDPVRVNALARSLRVSVASVSDALGRLRDRGLVTSPRRGFWALASPEGTDDADESSGPVVHQLRPVDRGTNRNGGRGRRRTEEVRLAAADLENLEDREVELAVALAGALDAQRDPEPAGAVPPCRNSTDWDYVEGDFDRLVRAVDTCQTCPFFAACEQALRDCYPQWGDQRHGTLKTNPIAVIWAGRAFDLNGLLQTPARVVKKVAEKARAHQQHEAAA